MICNISKVIVFTKNEKKNDVSFNAGLNIISGVSQTGKSSIIEIIDYCLASTASYIPKGVIIDNSLLYCIVIDIKDSYMILARRPFNYDDKNEIGRRKMFIKIEPKSYFSDEDIQYSYFEKYKYCYRSLDEVKKEIENFFGISVYKQAVYEGNEVKSERVSVRSMVSFLYQHQNLIANKFALFYRFDELRKKIKTITQFPVFLGIVDQNYYNIWQRKESKEKELKKLEKNKKLDNELKDEIAVRIKEDIREYYRLIGKDISDIEIEDILKLEKNLDKLLIEDINIDESLRICNQLEDELKDVNSKVYILDNEINNIDLTLNSGNDVKRIINNVNEFEDDTNNEGNFICPFCNSEVKSLSNSMQEISKCKKILNDSLDAISVIKKEYLEEEKNKLNEKVNVYAQKQLKLRKEISDLKLKHKKIKEKSDFKELIIEKRIRIENDINKIYLHQRNEDDSIDALKNEVRDLKEQLNGYDLDNRLNEVQFIIDVFMNKIAKKLDFEKGYTPNLKFDAKTFDLYQYNEDEKEKIFLSNMGSGSNWLTCHLALFLGLHYYFAKLGNKCSIPSILVIDQPSQVYFPNMASSEKDVDVDSVRKIYEALEWAIEYIEEKTGNKIQIIVLDHVLGLKFKNKEFSQFVRKRWNDKGDGLIKKENILKL